jgi:DHA1 family bicyclomycin/chloramphenicol resistance-like MFS transporter
VVLGSLTLIGAAAVDIYLPALPQVSVDLGVSASTAQLTLAAYFVGLGIGQLVAGPLSDAYGRRRPIVLGTTVYAGASLACAVAPSLPFLAGFRLVQGFAASFGMVIGRAVVRDLFSGAAAARYLSRLIIIVGLAPILAPSLAGVLLRFTSWRGLFVLLVVIGAALTLAAMLFLPETNPPERRSPGGVRTSIASLGRLLQDPAFDRLALIIGLASVVFFAYLAGSSFVYQEVYGLSRQAYGLMFGGTAIMLVIGAQVNAHLLRTAAPRRLLGLGLTLVALSSTCLLLVVVTGTGGVAALAAPLAVIVFSWAFIQSNGIALALQDHPEWAGSAAGLIGTFQFGFGAAAAPIAGAGGKGTALPMALEMFVAAWLSLLLARSLVQRRTQPDDGHPLGFTEPDATQAVTARSVN